MPIIIEKNAVPKFEKVSDLKNWIVAHLPLVGEIIVKTNGRKVYFSKTSIGRSLKDPKRYKVKTQSYFALKEIVENAHYYGIRSDDKHPRKQEVYYQSERHSNVHFQQFLLRQNKIVF